MISFLMVFLGGGIGASLRYLISLLISKTFGHTYYGTFLINVLGCFLIGLIVAVAVNKPGLIPDNSRIFLTVGILGGFTTFSAFGYEAMALIENGHSIASTVYMASSVIIGLMTVYLGTYLAKYI